MPTRSVPQRELIPVPSGLDAAEAVSLVLNYVTVYQMLHRSAKVRSGQSVLIRDAAGGVGSRYWRSVLFFRSLPKSKGLSIHRIVSRLKRYS